MKIRFQPLFELLRLRWRTKRVWNLGSSRGTWREVPEYVLRTPYNFLGDNIYS